MMLLSSFIFGLAFGSFLNVVIYRLKNGGSIVLGRSFCPNCKHQLKWHDLVPILSFVWLRGLCRYCHKKISWQYPIVEILSGLIWVGVFYKNFNGNFSPFGGSPIGGQFSIFNLQFLNQLNFFYYVLILSALLVIAVYDFKWLIISDKIVYPAVAIVFIYDALNVFKSGNSKVFIISIIVASSAFLFFFLIYFFSKGHAMGLGDAKLALLIGLFLKPFLALIAFNLAFVIGAVYGIILLMIRKKTLKSQIAFGPFLVLGAILAFFLSNFINNFLIF